jgi:hypothetical protein
MKALRYPLLITATLLASWGCFRPDLICKPCGAKNWCPSGLMCSADNLCTRDGVMCEVDRPDAGSPNHVDTAPPPPPDAGAPLDSPPDEAVIAACTERCCIGAQCLTVGDRLRRSLVLWADRTSLPAPGGTVTRWLDRSGLGNHIVAHNLGAPPRVQRDEVGPLVEIDETGHVLRTEPGPALELGAKDFVIMVLARCDARTVAGALFDKQTGARPLAGVSLYCNHNGAEALPLTTALTNNRMFLKVSDAVALTGPSEGAVASQHTFDPGTLHLVVARRTEAARLQLRVDGQLEAEVRIAADTNLYDQRPAFVGADFSTLSGVSTTFDGGLAAVIVVRGPMLDQEVEELESFVLRSMGPAAAPL